MYFYGKIFPLSPRVPIYIFGNLRVHRVLLCIWFPRDTGVLTVDFVKTLCGRRTRVGKRISGRKKEMKGEREREREESQSHESRPV